MSKAVAASNFENDSNKGKPRAFARGFIIYKEYWRRLLLLERGILQDFFDQVLHVFFPVALAHGKAEVDASLEGPLATTALLSAVAMEYSPVNWR